eukprot:1451448-Rhodomonas_salina.2
MCACVAGGHVSVHAGEWTNTSGRGRACLCTSTTTPRCRSYTPPRTASSGSSRYSGAESQDRGLGSGVEVGSRESTVALSSADSVPRAG